MKTLPGLFVLLVLTMVAGCTTPPSSPPPLTTTTSPYLFRDTPTSTAYPNQWTILTNIGYESAYDESFGNPAWVAYHLTGPAGTPAPRPSIGYPTDNRSTAKVSQTDYPSGYDHGHMAPNSAIATFFGADAQNETFLMTNMVPQRHGLNAGPWKTVETDEIAWEKTYQDVWVICGPVYTTADDQPVVPQERYGPKQVSIPPYCFKLIVTKDTGGKISTLAFIMPQENASGHKPKEFLTSIREIEKRTGLNFFSTLVASEQDVLELPIAPDLWPLP